MYVEILKIGLVYMCHSYKETSSGLLFRDVVYSALCPIKIYLLITATQNELLNRKSVYKIDKATSPDSISPVVGGGISLPRPHPHCGHACCAL